MPDSVLTVFALLAALLTLGGIIGFFQRDQFNIKWFIVAVSLTFFNLFLNFRCFGMLPTGLNFEGAQWNWVGKALGLAGTLVIMSLPSFGWRRCGMTLHQNVEGRTRTYLAAVAFCVVFGTLIFLFQPSGPVTKETLAFQMTMPGFEEEPMYRGTLLFALNEAFRGKTRILWASIGWGGVLTVIMFGCVHAIHFSNGSFSFGFGEMIGTGVIGFILLWFRERSGSLVLPVLIHNYVNTILRLA